MAFAKDPFSTHVGHLIEINTVGTANSEDWGQFMNICDVINTTEEGPKEAVKALKRRISKNYNHKEVRLSLSLLDMCMQNCCATFQALVVKKDFCKVLVKLLNPKYNLPIVMQNKILHFIMTWSRGLEGGSINVSDVKEIYLDLLKRGISFPPPETNGELPFEEHVSSPENCKQQMPSGPSKSCCEAPPPAAPTLFLAPEQIGKLYSELEMVKSNMIVMSAILLENAPDTSNLDDIDLLQKLNTTCRSMQERILQLLAAVQNEDVTAELIQVNDDLNNTFLRYERFSRNRIRLSEDHERQPDSTEIDNSRASAPTSDLVDFGYPPHARHFQTPAADTTIPTTNVDIFTTGLENSPHSAASHRYSNLMSTSVTDPVTTKPSLYPQLGLLMLGDDEPDPFTIETRSEGQRLPPARFYDNGISALPPVYQHPTVLETPELVSASLETEATYEGWPTMPADLKKDTSPPPPSYYELIEFDPLADTNGTEAIYEEIDPFRFNPGVRQNTEC